MKKLPRYTEPDRYPYHFACTRIMPALKLPQSKYQWAREQTHGCWCSAWKQKPDGTFLHWRDYAWKEPIPGSIKSKPIEPALTP